MQGACGVQFEEQAAFVQGQALKLGPPQQQHQSCSD